MIWALVGESGSAAAAGGARSAAVQLAMLGLLIGLIGLGALIVWTMLRWLRLRMEARESAASRRGDKPKATVSAWAEAGQRIGGGARAATPWPSIANPNLQDPISRILEREDDDDSLDETRPMDSDPELDDTSAPDSTSDAMHDTDEEDRWEFEGGGHDPNHDSGDDDDEHETGFGDDSIGFDGDDTDDPDDPDDTDDPGRRERW